VEELLCLRQLHAEAYAKGSPSVIRACDWHDRYRPGVATRLARLVRECGLDQHVTGGDADRPPAVVPIATATDRIARAHARGVQVLPLDEELTEARQIEEANH
jgi:hypothetical protein